MVALSQSEGVYKHRNVDNICTLNGINMTKEPRNEGLHNFYFFFFQNSHLYVTIK